MASWDFWHRITSRIGKLIKHEAGNPFEQLRGPYAKDYYRRQLMQFKRSIDAQEDQHPERYRTTVDFLCKIPGIKEQWDQIEAVAPIEIDRIQTQTPVPFYRPDHTYCALVELAVPMPETDGYILGAWIPTDEIAFEYLADLRREVDEANEHSAEVFFLEDWEEHFISKEERLVLGLELPAHNL